MADANPAAAPAPAPAPSDGPIIGLNIRKEATSRSAILGILPKGAIIEIGERSADGKWGRIATLAQGQIAPARKDGTVDPAASSGWVFLGELDKEGGEPELKDDVYVLPKPYPTIKAGELVGHIGEYQRYREATPLPPTPKRPLLHLEVFAGDTLPAFIAKSRARAAQLPADQKTILVIDKGARLVLAVAAPDQTLPAGSRLKETADSPKTGRWSKGKPMTLSIKPSSALTGYNAQSKTYASGDVFTGKYVGTSDTDLIDEHAYKALSASAKHAYSRRQVLSPAAGDALWVQRSQLGGEGDGSAWRAFPLRIADAAEPAVGFTFTISRASLDALPATAKAVDDKGVHWWQVSLGAEGGGNQSGWVCEKDHPHTQWQSPWAWPGFELVDATSVSVADTFKRFLSITGTASGAEAQSFQPAVAAVNGSDLVVKLEQAVDAQGNKDGAVTALELKAAQRIPWLAQSISHLIVKYESEWGGDMSRWDQLSSLMGERKFVWQGELGRIKKLQWWSKVAAAYTWPGPVVYHIHAIGIITNFRVEGGCDCEARFKKISPIILRHEGGFVDNPADPGGATNKGIAWTAWQAYARPDLGVDPTLENLKSLTNDQAEKIYLKRYWTPKGFCQMKSERTALMIYDWTITSGRAVQEVKKVVNSFYQKGLQVNNTLSLEDISAINEISDQDDLVAKIGDARKRYYRSLTVDDNGRENAKIQFLTGWLNRVDDCLEYK